MARVLITGASGGFGLLTVKQLVGDAHSVVGTSRDVTGRNRTKAAEIEEIGARVVEMDVTDDSNVARGVEAAIRHLGGIDVLINNAGVGVLGLTEAFTADDVKRVFDINVFGVHRVTRAVLPTMRTASQGLVINISSLLGRIAIPFYGPYNASKWALEALSENYRVEVSQLGVEVCLVEPGGFPTTFVDNLLRPSDSERVKAYGSMSDAAEPFLKNFEKALAANPSQDPRNVAKAIAGLVAAPHGTRPVRTVVDNMGMGGPISEYNSVLGKITGGIYGNFGIGHLLTVKGR